MIRKIITKSPEETIEAAAEIGKLLQKGDIIAYHGGLGAGKTTFTRGLALGLGLGDVVTSPTFALVNEYIGDEINLYHFDMYRITDEDDLYSTGFFDYLDAGAILVVEWSEKWFGAIPAKGVGRPTLPVEPRQVRQRRKTVHRNVPQDALYMVFHMGGRCDSDFFPCDVISDVLSNGYSGRLMAHLVRKKKIFTKIGVRK